MERTVLAARERRVWGDLQPGDKTCPGPERQQRDVGAGEAVCASLLMFLNGSLRD